MIVRATTALLLCLVAGASAHGDHGHGHDAKALDKSAGYIRSHMVNEHHIDTFDIASFFLLHDLDRDGFWDRGEIEAVYGVHHDWNPKDKNMEKVKAKADAVVEKVLKLLDKDGDGRISKAELETAGLDGLPDLSDLGAEGHHYDIESEFFLHHEELYHNTPETQTDEAYSHPEDEEHFANHEHIEAEEERRERLFQGLPPDGDSSTEKGHDHDHDHEHAQKPVEKTDNDAADKDAARDHNDGAAHPHDDEKVFQEHGEQQQPIRERPNYQREVPPEKKNPTDRYRDDKFDADTKPAYGEGGEFLRPKTPAERMRRNVPYKYKFKRNWGDF